MTTTVATTSEPVPATMTQTELNRQRCIAATIAGLIAIVANEIEDPDTAEAIGRALAAGALQLRVAIVITAQTTVITAGIANDSEPPVAIFTREVPTTWPAELAGVGQPRH